MKRFQRARLRPLRPKLAPDSHFEIYRTNRAKQPQGGLLHAAGGVNVTRRLSRALGTLRRCALSGFECRQFEEAFKLPKIGAGGKLGELGHLVGNVGFGLLRRASHRKSPQISRANKNAMQRNFQSKFLLCRIRQFAHVSCATKNNFHTNGLFRHLGFARAAEVIPQPAALGATTKRQTQHDNTENGRGALLHGNFIACRIDLREPAVSFDTRPAWRAGVQ